MQFKRLNSTSNTHDFFSKEMSIAKISLRKLTQIYLSKKLISDLDYKHKGWSKSIDRNF